MAMTTVHLIRRSFDNSKTIRGTYLLLELIIFVQIFDFYLVTQSLLRNAWAGEDAVPGELPEHAPP
jgi:hypothetical protein